MNELNRHVAMLLISFRTNLKNARQDADVNDIHNLRLDLKQLFALFKVLKLLKIQHVNDFKESLLLIKVLFKQTGILRDNQLIAEHGQEVLGFDALKELKKHSDKNILQTQHTIAELLQTIDLIKVERDLALAFKETMHLKSAYILEHIKAKIQKDEESIQKQLENKECDYHRIRRNVKEQYYLLCVIKDVLGENVGTHTIANKKQQAKVLGDWHDWVVFEELIQKWEVELDDATSNKIKSISGHFLNTSFKKSLIN